MADIAIIPGGLTSQLQPLDVSVNKPFKDKVRVLWTEWIAGSTDHALTRGGRLKKTSITLWCEWVLKAWNEIDTAIIVKAFKKCGILMDLKHMKIFKNEQPIAYRITSYSSCCTSISQVSLLSLVSPKTCTHKVQLALCLEHLRASCDQSLRK